MKIFKKLSFPLVAAIICSVIFASTSFAVGVSPVNNKLTAAPGETIAGELKIYSTEAVPSNFSVVVQDYYFSAEQNTKIFVDEFLPRGLHEWLTLDSNEAYLDPQEEHVFTYTIAVPADAAPGTYSTAFAAGGDTAADGSSFGMLAKAISYVELTIEGDYTEGLDLVNFELDKPSFLKGEIVFNTTTKNTGDISIAPSGAITIYDEKGEQIKEIAAVYQTFNGNLVEVGRKDELDFNPALATTLPGEIHVYKTAWKDRKIEPGKYTAKIKMFYGENETELEKETKIELVENFYISDLSVDSYYNASLPVSFAATIQNTGTSPLEPTGYFEVKNMFGSQKKRVDLTKEELAVKSGEEKTLNNLVWADGFAIGYYSASLTLDVGGKIYTKSTSFMVINWWQTLLVVVVLLLIIFVIVKGVKSYMSLRKKLKEMESKKSEE